MDAERWRYDRLKALLREEPLPAVVVDLDALEANARRFRDLAAARGKRVRLATKSVRVPDLLRVALAAGDPVFRGLMAYGCREAAFLATLGFDDIFVAYPSVARVDVEALHGATREGRRVVLALDSPEQAERLDGLWKELGGDRPLNVALDVDVSLRPFGGVHLGVRRSPVRSIADFVRLFDVVAGMSRLRFAGVMAYEAQVAGLADENPTAPLLNPAKRLVKALSRREVRLRRAEIAAFLASRGVTPDFFNGGGSGSFTSTSAEPAVTEVTVGSGLLQSRLFDYYRDNFSEPAFAFALPVTRLPEPGVVTCQGGGFIASGETGADRNPVPFLPPELSPFGTEGFGEVQTPLRGEAASRLSLGDPVFFRPAKAGELAERFTEYLLVRQGEIVGRAPTYRGLGQCFH